MINELKIMGYIVAITTITCFVVATTVEKLLNKKKKI